MDNESNVTEVNDHPIDILLVEDNEADVKITLRAFQKARIKNNVQVVNDGQAALDFMKKFPRPDLILLDINMPKLSGFEVLKKLKADPKVSFIPVVMLTSSKSEEDVLKSYQNGAVSFIPKPVASEAFAKVVDGFNFYWHIINKLPHPAKQAIE